jgi:exosortase
MLIAQHGFGDNMGSSVNPDSEGTSWVAIILAFLPVVLVLAIFAPTIKQVAQICMENDDYSHGILLPLISLALVYMKRDELLVAWKKAQLAPSRFSITGLLLLLSGLLLYIFAEVSGGILFFHWCALFPSLLGTLFLVLGTRPGWVCLPPILLVFMARPIPESLVPLLFNPLQVFAAQVSAAVLELLDVPVYLVGNIIEIPGMRLLVEEACSGMRSVMALLTVAMIVAYLVSVGFWGFLVLAIVSVLIAVFFNILRVALTGVLAHFVDAELATGFFHEFTGMIVFVVGLLILYSLTSWFVSLANRRKFTSKKGVAA